MPPVKGAAKKAAAKGAAKKAPAKDPLDAAMAKFEAQMDKSYGEGTMIDLADAPTYDVVPTGSLSLDDALVVGGLVRGRQYEIWGPEHSGKSTLASEIVASHQQHCPRLWALYVDVEKRVDLPWFVAHGVDPRRTKLIRPQTSEEVADQIKSAMRSRLFSIIVVDSVGAMIAQAEIDKDAGESAMGKNPGIITRMVKMATALGMETNTTTLYINQVRADLSGSKYATITTGGGFALKHCTTARLKTSRSGGGTGELKVRMDGEDQIVGYTMGVKVERNSVGPAYRVAKFVMVTVDTDKYGPIGIDRADEAVTLGLRTGVLEQAGAWITDTTTGERFNGREKVLDAYRADPIAVLRIRDAVLASVAHEVTEEDQTAVAFRRGMQESAGDDTDVSPEALAALASQIEEIEGDDDPESDDYNPDGVTLPHLLQGDS